MSFVQQSKHRDNFRLSTSERSDARGYHQEKVGTLKLVMPTS